MNLAKITRRPRRGVTAESEVQRSCSVLSHELRAVGRIESLGVVYIHGTVEGDVCAPKVVVCADGYLRGNVAAQEAILDGTIKGRVFAFSVMIGSTAQVHGHVFHHEMTMEPGAHFEGRAPWRPVNYFDDISRDFEGDSDEYVQSQR